jgi:hypothetical protein
MQGKNETPNCLPDSAVRSRTQISEYFTEIGWLPCHDVRYIGFHFGIQYCVTFATVDRVSRTSVDRIGNPVSRKPVNPGHR